MIATATAHIWLDERGTAWIDDTNVKVIEIALDRIANSWSAEEIQQQDPSLSLAQIHAALAYYYDHQHEFDEQIARDRKEVRRLAAQAADSPLRRRLRSLGELASMIWKSSPWLGNPKTWPAGWNTSRFDSRWALSPPLLNHSRSDSMDEDQPVSIRGYLRPRRDWLMG